MIVPTLDDIERYTIVHRLGLKGEPKQSMVAIARHFGYEEKKDYNKEKFDISRLVIEKNDDGVAKTYGKGIMQTTYLMLDGGAFKLTTAVMYQPDKTTTIHGKGIIVSGDNATERGDSAILRALETLS